MCKTTRILTHGRLDEAFLSQGRVIDLVFRLLIGLLLPIAMVVLVDVGATQEETAVTETRTQPSAAQASPRAVPARMIRGRARWTSDRSRDLSAMRQDQGLAGSGHYVYERAVGLVMAQSPHVQHPPEGALSMKVRSAVRCSRRRLS